MQSILSFIISRKYGATIFDAYNNEINCKLSIAIPPNRKGGVPIEDRSLLELEAE